ncbi:MAG: glycosyltransferase family 4 protein [Salinivirgaceae bacterium]|nr:glycosyltransferase family 4 protein [Salinivirgaceae bacterium]
MDQNQDTQTTILSIVPSPLIPPVSKGQKHTYGLLDALGEITKVVSITDTHSTTAGHSFELRPLIEHNIRKYLAFGNYKLLYRLIIRLKPKAILLEQPYMGLMVSLVSKKTKVPFSVHAHNVEFLRQKALGKWWWPMVFWLERYTFRKAKYIFFISENDKNLAVKKYLISEQKCFVSPFGLGQTEPLVSSIDLVKKIRAKHNISAEDKVFMFFGDMKYLQNIVALELIINEIQPRIDEKFKGKDYKILICGGGLSEAYEKQLKELESQNIIYAGYIHDVDEYLQAADVVINPIQHTGGIKIKVTEALGYNKPVVSTKTGAAGVVQNVCGNMLQVSEDNDWDNFTEKMYKMKDNKDSTPKVFFEKYNWKFIASDLLNKLIP